MSEIRIGQGFDLHRLVDGRPFVLGGVLFDHPKGPLGHSDGDVLLHAITDALLGASGLGDIGDWFSADNPDWADANSKHLLQIVYEAILNAGWQVGNVDTTVLLETPKLGAQKETLRQKLADILMISPDRVSVKAKTMEQLGPIGHGDAIAAMASVLLLKSP